MEPTIYVPQGLNNIQLFGPTDWWTDWSNMIHIIIFITSLYSHSNGMMNLVRHLNRQSAETFAIKGKMPESSKENAVLSLLGLEIKLSCTKVIPIIYSCVLFYYFIISWFSSMGIGRRLSLTAGPWIISKHYQTLFYCQRIRTILYCAETHCCFMEPTKSGVHMTLLYLWGTCLQVVIIYWLIHYFYWATVRCNERRTGINFTGVSDSVDC